MATSAPLVQVLQRPPLKSTTYRRVSPARGDTPWVVAGILALVLAPRPGHAVSRVLIPDPRLSAAVEQALSAAAAHRPAVAQAFGVTLRGDETWLAGDLAACKASGATSYIRRSVPGTAYACPSLADASAAERAVYVLHEELHLAGVTDSHGPDGKDPAQGMNAAIIRACCARSKGSDFP